MVSNPVGWGIQEIYDTNNVPIGTSAEEVRRIFGALYSPGIINGSGIHTGISTTHYIIDPGVVAIRVGNTPPEVVLAAFDRQELSFTPANGTARTDIFYVRQHLPTTEVAVNAVQVGVGTTLPANSVELARYHVPASATTPSNTWLVGSMRFAVPYAANLGIFYQHLDTSNTNLPRTVRTGASGTIDIPTDRICLFTIDTCLSARRSDGTTRAVRFDDAAYCEAKFDILIDGVRKFTFNTPGLHQAWADYHFQQYVNLKAGEHTVSYKTYTPASSMSPGIPWRHYSGTDASTGTTFTVRDAGFWDEVLL